MTDEQFAALMSVLWEIRDALQALTTDEVIELCTHPEEMRQSFAGMGDAWWRCKQCGFDSQAGMPAA